MPRRKGKKNVLNTQNRRNDISSTETQNMPGIIPAGITAARAVVTYGPDVFNLVKSVYDWSKSKNESDADQEQEGSSEEQNEKMEKKRKEAKEELERERQAYREETDRIKKDEQERVRIMQLREERQQQANREETERIRAEAQARVDRIEAEVNEKFQRKLEEMEAALREELKRSAPEANAAKDQIKAEAEAALKAARTEDAVQKDPEENKSRSAAQPSFCQQYWSKRGCRKEACKQLHLCKLLLAGICKFGDRCRNDHSLHSMHNKMVCMEEGVPMSHRAVDDLQQLFSEKHSLGPSFYHKHLELCLRRAATPCQDCNRIHLCRQYVEGTCHRQSSCRFGHNLNTQHNRRVLDRHRAGGLIDVEILQLLRDNLAAKSGRVVRAQE